MGISKFGRYHVDPSGAFERRFTDKQSAEEWAFHAANISNRDVMIADRDTGKVYGVTLFGQKVEQVVGRNPHVGVWR